MKPSFITDKKGREDLFSFICPFCKAAVAVSHETQEVHLMPPYGSKLMVPNTEKIEITFHRCASCKRLSAFAGRKNEPSFNTWIYPQASFVSFPEYVPQAIREDYEEASKIVDLSPKAAATLCRRCLQGMIHDYWGIHEKNLNAELSTLKPKIPPAQWHVINAVREIGNIGAHMEYDVSLIVDIEPDEARKLLQLIERLIKSWYVDRHEEEELYEEIVGINTSAQEERKPH